MIEELNTLVNNHSTIKVRAYYKVKDSLKHYYDYQLFDPWSHGSKGSAFPLETDGPALNGSYDLLPVDELLYYLKEQVNGN